MSSNGRTCPERSTRITWTEAKRTLGDLLPWERNQRQIGERQAERLTMLCQESDGTEQ